MTLLQVPARMTAHINRRLILIPVCLLAACSGPNHLGNPLTLPVRAITNAAENGAYNRERAGVKTWITTNEAAMRAEGFSGPVTASILATLPAGARDQARRDLVEAALYSDFTERATVIMVIIMVHRP